MSSPFKAYDIRGRYGESITEELALGVGRALVDYLGASRVVVGRDLRLSSEALAEALIRGIRKQGATAVDLGEVSTPMTYFANVALDADVSVMVTASHNPPEDNGFKINRRGALPVGMHSGLAGIRRLVEERRFLAGCCAGGLEHHDIKPAYWARMRCEVHFGGRPRIVCDYANMAGILEMRGLADLFDLVPLFDEPDGACPNHPANPLHTETLDTLRATVCERGACFGVAFDGDADRLGFVDERGGILRMDLVTPLLAEEPLAAGPAPILHDVRTGWAARERLRELGAVPVCGKVGHAFMKPLLRALRAPFGGELAGHYYFGELQTSESPALALIRMMNLVERRGESLSMVAGALRRYADSGEINLSLPDARIVGGLVAAVRDRWRGVRHEVDGLSVEYGDWWFNLRASNTEPKLRLLIEAADETVLAAKRAELEGFIRQQAAKA